MEKQGIQTSIHYSIPTHKQKAYSEHKHLSFTITEKTHQKAVTISLNKCLIKVEISKIIKAVNNYLL